MRTASLPSAVRPCRAALKRALVPQPAPVGGVTPPWRRPRLAGAHRLVLRRSHVVASSSSSGSPESAPQSPPIQTETPPSSSSEGGATSPATVTSPGPHASGPSNGPRTPWQLLMLVLNPRQVRLPSRACCFRPRGGPLPCVAARVVVASAPWGPLSAPRWRCCTAKGGGCAPLGAGVTPLRM